MVNLVLYLSDEEKARILMNILLREKLLAHAALNASVETLTMPENEVVRGRECVITAQTKAVLFDEITRLVKKHYGNEIRIFSFPIAQCNDAFSEVIRTETKEPG